MNIKRSALIPALALTVIAGGLTAGVLLPTPAPVTERYEEDMPCWVCSPDDDSCADADPDAGPAWAEWDRQGAAKSLKVDCAGAFRVDFMGATTHLPENTDALDLVVPGVTKNYIFRATCL